MRPLPTTASVQKLKALACTTSMVSVAVLAFAMITSTSGFAADEQSDEKPIVLAQANGVPQRTGTNPCTYGPSQLMIENRSGMDIDLLQQRNGQYQLVTVLRSGYATPLNAFNCQTYFFGVGGQAIVGSYTVPFPRQGPVRLGPEVLANAGIQPPQQQQQAFQQPQFQGQNQQFAPQQQFQGQQQQGFQGQQQQAFLPNQTSPQQFGQNPQNQLQQPRQNPLSVLPEITPSAPPVLPPEARVPPKNPELAALTERRAFKNQPWMESPHDSILVVPQTGKGALTTNQHGEFEIVSLSQARSGATWFFEQIGDKEQYYIRNVQEPDKFIYVDETTTDGAAPKFGPEGAQTINGRWSIAKDQFGNYDVITSDARPEFKLAFSGNTLTVTTKSGPRSETNWLLSSVKGMKEFMGFMEENVDAFVQMDQNIKELERQEAEREKQRLEEEESRRLAQQKTPWISGGGNGQDYLTMRMGFGNVEEPVPGEVYGLRYLYDAPQQPRLIAGPFQTDTTDKQTVELFFRPEVYAFVDNGKLYVRLKTSDGTILQMAKNGIKPAISDTESTFFIGGVRKQSWLYGGPAIRVSPVSTNTATDGGFNRDSTSGIDLSIESFGGNYSESVGKNVNFSSFDYRVSGGFEKGGASYSWEGCGLAVTVSTIDNCTYSSALDLWDEDTASLRNMKDISLTMPLVITDTLFVVDTPKARLQDSLNLSINIAAVLHGISTIKNSPNNSTWDEFATGFTYVFRPDKWDVNESLEDQTHIRNNLTEKTRHGAIAGFTINLNLDISQLKPYMN